MAIWQFNLKAIPKNKISNISSEKNIYFDEDIISWKGYNLSDLSIDQISKKLMKMKSWSNDIIQLGAIDETCIELFYENQQLEEFSIRLDLRTINQGIINEIIEFLKINEAILVAEDGSLLYPNIDDIINSIKGSNSYLFLRNPNDFFDSYGKIKKKHTQ